MAESKRSSRAEYRLKGFSGAGAGIAVGSLLVGYLRDDVSWAMFGIGAAVALATALPERRLRGLEQEQA